MPIDPQAKELGEALGADLDLSTVDLVTLRQAADAAACQGPRPEVAHCEDRRVPGPDGDLLVRVYRPEVQGDLPCLVYFHGGGWALCSIETHDATCRKLANGAGCAVVSVDYRLAPEHRFPAAAEDGYAATRWVADHADALGVDRGRIAVGGDSAGGNLAAVIALMARDRGEPRLCHQLLVYPITDHDFETGSYRDNAAGPLLTRSMMQSFWNFYVPDGDRSDPYVSPLRADDLSALPPATIVTAEYDPLRDEGEAYAARLREAGVAVTASRYDGMIHGFFGFDEILPAARRAVDDASSALREAFAAR
jgi:acetyl esterase